MNKNNLKELLEKNRSYRTYDENYILDKETITILLENTRYIASRKNLQPLKYYYVLDKDTVKKIVDISKWGALLPNVKLPPNNHYPTAIIIIYLDSKIEESIEKTKIEIGMAAQTILLSAVELGIGGCVNQSFDKQKLREIVCVDWQYKPVLIIALGKVEEEVSIIDNNTGEINYKRIDGVHYVPKRLLSELIINRRDENEKRE